jgi:hypothetical protein
MTRLSLLLLSLVVFTACQDDDDPIAPILNVPATYAFERDGQSTVSFDGQTTRIQMAEELVDALKEPQRSELELDNMFRNAGPNGEDVDPFAQAELNSSSKSIRSKVAASRDYFFADATSSAAIRSDFDGWIAAQVSEVFPRWNELATPGQAGQIADGSSTRYVNGQGLEYDQAFGKSLIGALMVDQMLNNYLSPAVLDEAQNRADNDAIVPADGQAYTTMEHKWDEAYGYLFGNSANPASPIADLGEDDFLNKYLGRLEGDADYAGTAERIHTAFRTGRAAIVAGDYDERDRQADIIQRLVSRIVGVRAVYYLAQGATALENDPTKGGAFHDLSEGYGFIYSMQFTRNPDTDRPYFSGTEVREMLDELTADATGFWALEAEPLRAMARRIADRFDLNYAEAAE